jgi:hypothetical protein
VEGILQELQTKQFLTVSDYLDLCYEDGFVGSLFDLHGQGVPMAMPLNQESMVKAVQLDSKISKGLYTRLGEDVDLLKKKITAQVSRSIATGVSFQQTAKQLAGYTRIGYNNAIRIARTEGHRIQCSATHDAAQQAKDRGADIVKMWDATLDGKTRESHVAVDGQIRELDETFSNGLMFPGDPAGGAAEVINCRCAYLQKARRWLDGSFTKVNNFTKQIESFDRPEDYEEFKKGFFSPENKKFMNYAQQMEAKYGKDWNRILDQMTDREYKHHSKLLGNNPLYNTKATGMTIDDCKTVTDVEDLMKSKRWFRVKDINGKVFDTNDGIKLSGLDLECAKGVYKAHEEVFGKYPQLVGKLNSVTGKKLAPDVYAECSFGLGHGGIDVNVNKFSDVTRLIKSYENDLRYGFHPAGTDWSSIVTHELGHAIDDYLTNTLHAAGFQPRGWKPKTVSGMLRPKVMKAAGFKVSDTCLQVSGYATKDAQEWFAECFAEYMKSENPRRVATEFGKQLDAIMKGVT